MTTITINRATVEQALEALEADCGGRCNAEYNPCWQREVAETLRTALAQQAEPQTTHSTECWRWHHKCAVAKIERECKHD